MDSPLLCLKGKEILDSQPTLFTVKEGKEQMRDRAQVLFYLLSEIITNNSGTRQGIKSNESFLSYCRVKE